MAIETRTPFVVAAAQGAGPAFLLDTRFCPGNVYFVQSTHTNKGDTAGRGRTPDAPFATIAYAVGQCTANQGDLIVALPGHVETCTAAGTVTVNKAGVTILGIGTGRLRPRVLYTTAVAASFD